MSNIKNNKITKSDLKQLLHKNRIKRFALLRNSRRIFLEYAKKTNVFTNDLHKVSRTINCKYALSGGFEKVEVHCDSKTAYYVGLQTCGSIWTCPVCAARISETRRKEVCHAMEKIYEEGFQSVMVTLTFPHDKTIALDELIKKQSLALKYLREGNTWTCFKKRINFQGLIRALELTYGANGWHPHTHELWFVDKGLKEKDIKTFIVNRWINCLKKAGLVSVKNTMATHNALKTRSVDIKMNCKSSDYLSKNDNLNWGIDREIAKAVNKGKSKGYHPFEFLEEITEVNSKLFIEYSKAMKGKSQLFWTPGLKEKLGVDDMTDEDICNEEDSDNENPLFDREIYFTEEEWEIIAKKEYRAKILNYFENAGEKIDECYEKIIDLIKTNIENDKIIEDERKKILSPNPVPDSYYLLETSQFDDIPEFN